MITFLVIVVALVSVFALLRKLNPALLVVTSKKIPTVRALPRVEGDRLCLSLVLEHSTGPQFVTSLQVDRAEAETVGLGPPDGFVAEPMPQDGRSDPNWIADWNSKNIRFVGRLELLPGAEVTLSLPVTAAPSIAFLVKGRFVNGRRFGGTIGFFNAQVQPVSIGA